MRDSDSGIDLSRSRQEQKQGKTQDYWRQPNTGNTKNIMPDPFAITYSDGNSPYAEFKGQMYPRAYSEGPQLYGRAKTSHDGPHAELQGKSFTMDTVSPNFVFRAPVLARQWGYSPAQLGYRIQ